MIDVEAVISEMNGIGIRGLPEAGDAAATALNVIKKEAKDEDIPKTGVAFFAENQERARVVLKRMSAIADQMNEAAAGLRKHLQEADALLQEMDEAASEFRRTFNG